MVNTGRYWGTWLTEGQYWAGAVNRGAVLGRSWLTEGGIGGFDCSSLSGKG